MTPAGIHAGMVVSEDERLMEQVRTGNIDAFGELYDRYCDRAYRVASVVCHDHERAVNHGEAHCLRTLLTQLPDTQQEVIALAFYGELTHTEVTTALGLPARTVNGRMRLGLQKLRSSIEKEVA